MHNGKYRCTADLLLSFCWIRNIFACLVVSKPVKQEVSRTIILPPTVSVFWPRRRATFYCHYVFCMGVETSARIIPFLPDVLGATREVELRRVRGFAWELLCLWRTLPTRRCSKMQTKISPGVVVMGGDSCSRGCGFEFQHPILDGHFSHWFVVKIVIFVWKHENKTKKSRGWPILKKFTECHISRTVGFVPNCELKVTFG